MSFSRSLLVASLFLSACASDKVDLKSGVSTSVDTKPTDVNGNNMSANKNTDALSVNNGSIDSSSIGNNSLKTQDASKDSAFDVNKNFSIYFDFDRFEVKSDASYIIQGWSVWSASNPSQKLVIQGNTDERGGREYNLALGQKRAEAVMRSLKLSGVDESRLDAISFGKEKPIDAGSDEISWSKNRRADIVRK